MKNRIVKAVVQKARYFFVNRKYKDRLFRIIFKDKKDLLSLYNAINGTNYTNQDDLIFKTLEDAVYLGFKNDLSFLISNTLNLYEHQSTMNPNMPLRGLIYFTNMLKAYVEENRYDIYGSKLVHLPVPRYIVFYNGTKEQADRIELRLSDAFGGEAGEEYALECKAVMLNINLDHNRELMDKCQRLEGYAYFVESVRRYRDLGYMLDKAIDLAIEECIEKDKIADILAKNRAEVMDLLLTDFSERKYRKMIKKQAQEEGREEGRAEGREEGRAEGREEGRAEGREEGRVEGIEIGMENISRLNKLLLEDHRLEDLKRSVEDKNYLKELLKEYKLN